MVSQNPFMICIIESKQKQINAIYDIYKILKRHIRKESMMTLSNSPLEEIGEVRKELQLKSRFLLKIGDIRITEK